MIEKRKRFYEEIGRVEREGKGEAKAQTQSDSESGCDASNESGKQEKTSSSVGNEENQGK